MRALADLQRRQRELRRPVDAGGNVKVGAVEIRAIQLADAEKLVSFSEELLAEVDRLRRIVDGLYERMGVEPGEKSL